MHTDTAAARTLTLRIRYTRTAVHIEGFETATTGGGNDMGDHISYAAENHCPALTRGAIRMGEVTESREIRHADDPSVPEGRVRRVSIVREFTTAQAAYDAALVFARAHGGSRICLKCTDAAVRAGATLPTT